jgi:hypothetical protein
MVLAVRELVPARARDEWFAFLPEGESAHSAHWDMVCGSQLSVIHLIIFPVSSPLIRVDIPVYSGVP